jgi:hypothetical protein
MRRIPALLPVSAITAGLVLALAGCSGGGSRSTQAEQAMYAAVSQPLRPAASWPAGQKWAGGPAQGVRMAVPGRWVTVLPAARRRALHDVGLGQLKRPVLDTVLPGWGSPASATLADPGPGAAGGGYQAILTLSCTAAHLPTGTNDLTGLTTLAEQEFSAINSSNAQLGQTTVDGHPAVLVYNQMSVGTATVTALQYAIAAPSGRACYVTLATEKEVPYEPVFSRFRPGIQVLGA